MKFTNTPLSRLSARATGFITPAIVWAVWFAATYSLQGAGCSAGLQNVELGGLDVLRIILGALLVGSVVAFALLGNAGWRSSRRATDGDGSAGERQRFFARLTLLSSALFLVATLWVGMGIFFLAPCH